MQNLARGAVAAIAIFAAASGCLAPRDLDGWIGTEGGRTLLDEIVVPEGETWHLVGNVFAEDVAVHGRLILEHGSRLSVGWNLQDRLEVYGTLEGRGADIRASVMLIYGNVTLENGFPGAPRLDVERLKNMGSLRLHDVDLELITDTEGAWTCQGEATLRDVDIDAERRAIHTSPDCLIRVIGGTGMQDSWLAGHGRVLQGYDIRFQLVGAPDAVNNRTVETQFADGELEGVGTSGQDGVVMVPAFSKEWRAGESTQRLGHTASLRDGVQNVPFVPDPRVPATLPAT